MLSLLPVSFCIVFQHRRTRKKVVESQALSYSIFFLCQLFPTVEETMRYDLQFEMLHPARQAKFFLGVSRQRDRFTTRGRHSKRLHLRTDRSDEFGVEQLLRLATVITAFGIFRRHNHSVEERWRINGDGSMERVGKENGGNCRNRAARRGYGRRE